MGTDPLTDPTSLIAYRLAHGETTAPHRERRRSAPAPTDRPRTCPSAHVAASRPLRRLGTALLCAAGLSVATVVTFGLLR